MPIDPIKLRSRREQLRMRQSQAAAIAGVTRGRWCDMEHGRRIAMSVDVARRLAETLHCAIEDLLTDRPQAV